MVTSLLLLLPVSGSAWADDVLIQGTNFARVRIVGLNRGRLEVRMADGSLRAFPLHEVDLMQIDRGEAFVDFNQAERLRAEGHAAQSIARYRRAMRLTEGFWSEIIPARFLRAADEAGELEIAVTMFLRVVKGKSTGPTTAVWMFPGHVPDKRTGAVSAALDGLNGALTPDLDEAQRTVITVLRYHILQRIGGGDAGEARRVARLTIPEPVRTREVYDAVLDAVRRLMEHAPRDREILTFLEQAIRGCPDELLPDFLLMKGDMLNRLAVSEDDWLRATRPFLRVAIHFPDDPRAGAGYYGAAVALERAGRKEAAVSLLRLCEQGARTDRRTVQAARAMLERLAGSVGDGRR